MEEADEASGNPSNANTNIDVGEDSGQQGRVITGSTDSTCKSGRALWNGISQKMKAAAVLGAFRTLRDMCEDCFIDCSQLTVERWLGEGAFANVDLSVYDAPWGPMRVAVKRLKPKVFGCKRDVENFIMEGRLCKKLRNINLVETLGLGSFEENVGVNLSGDLDGVKEGSQPKNWYIVQEWMNHGSMKALVVKQQENRNQQMYTAYNALAWLLQVSKGLLYLHSANPRVIHRDIKLDNILLSEVEGGEVVAKIGDFGLSAIVPPAKGVLRSRSSRPNGFGSNIEELESSTGEGLYHLNPGTGSLLYMAPEVLGGTPYNEKADVFSFAIVIYELFCQSTILYIVSQYGGARDVELHALRVMGGFRPAIPASWPSDLKSLVEDCWAELPAGRPSMKEISSRLQQMQSTDFWSNPGVVLETPDIRTGEAEGTSSREISDSNHSNEFPEQPTTPDHVHVEELDTSIEGAGCFCFFRDVGPRQVLKGQYKSE